MKTFRYFSFFKRAAASLVMLFLTVSFLFVLVRIAPGDPSQKYLSPNLSPELLEKVRTTFELDKPVFTQYVGFLKNSLAGNFGISYSYHRPVTQILCETLPFTLIFSLLVFAVQFIVGGALGYSAFRAKQKWRDKLLTNINLFLYAVPAFVSGLLLVVIFSVWLQWLPSSGIKTIGLSDAGILEKFFDYFTHMLLPVATLSLAGIPVYFKYFREAFEENQLKQFVLYLEANGISERKIFFRHLLPNSLNAIIAYAGVDLGILFSGALLTEVIFGLPGMGRLAVRAILEHDYPLVVGCTLTAGVLIILTTLAADLIRMKIDKRLTAGLSN